MADAEHRTQFDEVPELDEEVNARRRTRRLQLIKRRTWPCRQRRRYVRRVEPPDFGVPEACMAVGVHGRLTLPEGACPRCPQQPAWGWRLRAAEGERGGRLPADLAVELVGHPPHKAACVYGHATPDDAGGAFEVFDRTEDVRRSADARRCLREIHGDR